MLCNLSVNVDEAFELSCFNKMKCLNKMCFIDNLNKEYQHKLWQVD